MPRHNLVIGADNTNQRPVQFFPAYAQSMEQPSPVQIPAPEPEAETAVPLPAGEQSEPAPTPDPAPAPVPSSQIVYNQAIIDGINKSAACGHEVEINIPEI